MNSTDNISVHYLNICIENFISLKLLADKAIEQINSDEIHFQLDAESNNIEVIMKHMAGNMISRWTDFLSSDGEKPDRNRDSEFLDENISRDDIIRYWNSGWKCLFDALSGLTGDDLLKTVYIRSEPHSVTEAIARQISHYAYHTGQIVFLAKLINSERWKTLSIPRGKSEEFNKSKFNK